MNIFDLHHKWMERKKASAKMKEKTEQENIVQQNAEALDVESPATNAAGKQQDSDVIDFGQIWKKIWSKKLWYALGFVITFILSCLYILDIPRYYQSATTMAPETETAPSSGGMLNSLASSFGVNLSQMQSSDAIQPLIYPDLMNDNGFVAQLFNIKIHTIDDSISTTYYNYLRYYQKQSSLSKVQESIMAPFRKEDYKGPKQDKKQKFNPYYVSKKDNDIIEAIRQNISISVDKKTNVISINTQAQDPMVCKILADSVRQRLQEFITNYRTSKSRKDVEYYQKLTNDARATYEKTRRQYATISDQNMDLLLETEKSKIEDLENTMQLQYNAYTALNMQLEAARTKLRMYTPVFTTVEGAAVPIKPAGPKRMIFVAFCLFLTFIVMSFVFLKDLIFKKKE